ncbi:hypothetical protein GRJ2_002551600 [Grus japonensis]|uniref:Uncharacterized protein n=1 Tax=Grus japonensis TaxID=30415 RepID=A0ABC9XT90_GRUJA
MGQPGPRLTRQTPTEPSRGQELQAGRDVASHRHYCTLAPPTSLPRRWAPRSLADACSAPGPSPHLVPSPADPLPWGAGDPQALEQGGSSSGHRTESSAQPLRCLVLRRGHTNLSSGKTPSMPSPAPYGLVLTPGSD